VENPFTDTALGTAVVLGSAQRPYQLKTTNPTRGSDAALSAPACISPQSLSDRVSLVVPAPSSWVSAIKSRLTLLSRGPHLWSRLFLLSLEARFVGLPPVRTSVDEHRQTIKSGLTLLSRGPHLWSRLFLLSLEARFVGLPPVCTSVDEHRHTIKSRLTLLSRGPHLWSRLFLLSLEARFVGTGSGSHFSRYTPTDNCSSTYALQSRAS
jgi:hypothetical protein